jgi:hypothetical protein
MSGAPRIARTRMNNTCAAHGHQRRLCRLRRLRHLRHLHHLQSLCRLRRLLVCHLYTTCPPELLQRLCHLCRLQPPTPPTATNAAYVASTAYASQRQWHLWRLRRQRCLQQRLQSHNCDKTHVQSKTRRPAQSLTGAATALQTVAKHVFRANPRVHCKDTKAVQTLTRHEL